MRNQVKPIERLARAADDFGKGRDVPGFRPAGAAEVRQAATAFLIMKQRIARQMQQRTEMLAGVSHDLRTPLTRMKLQLAMLGEKAEAKELREDVAEMEHMVEAYLAFARGEGSEQAVEMDLGELLRDVAAQAERQGGRVKVEVRGAPRLHMRPNGMRRCLANLIGNAVRYAKTVNVSAARKSGFVEIAVDDDGPGIPPAQREEAFRPFHRLDEGHTRGTGGAGLGLTIARDVARGHGGDVVLADSPMGGLRALVRLPV
jgi:two-component system osmolarity sensor histidine kinase EnvZ